MRVLEIVHGFRPAAAGGTELYAEAHTRALCRSGDDVVVLTRERDPARPEYEVRAETRDGFRIVWINNTFRHIRRFEETYCNDAVGQIAARVVDELKPDVAHIHHLTGLSTTIVPMLVARRVPSFVTLHDYWLMCHRGQLLDDNHRPCDRPPEAAAGAPFEGCRGCLGAAGSAGAVGFAGARALHALERRIPASAAAPLRRSAGRLARLLSSRRGMEHQERRRLGHMREVCGAVTEFLAPSRHMRDQFVRFGVPAGRITVAEYGVDDTLFRARHGPHAPRGASSSLSRPASGGGLRIGFLGTMMVSKAPHVLLEAVLRLPVGSVSVDLFGPYSSYHGDDSYRSRMDPLIEATGANLHGPIAHESVPDALASIDVLVVPSIWPENSPFVIREAFLAGVPVVASRIGGIPELVDEERNGLLFDAGDCTDLARVLARLLDDPRLLDRLRSAIPPVRSIADDAAFSRALYDSHLRRRRTGSDHARRSERCASGKKLAAVVLNYRTPDETLLAVKSVLASRRPIDDLIVVNNDSPDAASASWPAVESRITCLQTGCNLGFSGGMNAGIREALARGADRVLLVNSDVVIPPDTVEGLEECLDTGPGAGVVGPVVLSRSEPDRIVSLGMSYDLPSGRMRHLGHGSRIVGEPPGGNRIVDGVSGCLILVDRDVFDAVGLLDERYFFGFEDLDFCLKARRAGYTSLVAGSASVYHEGGRSLGALSPRRFYFATRNHLLLARQAGPPTSRAASLGRACWIVALNVASAMISSGGSPATRLAAVAAGTRDYMAGRFGSGW